MGGACFLGIQGELKPAGDGATYALKNTSVLVVGKHWGGFQDGVIDMRVERDRSTPLFERTE